MTTDADDPRWNRVRAAFGRVAYARFLGLELCETENGRTAICLDVRDDLKQNHGVVHGGAIASLIDTASAFAILAVIEQNEKVTTTDLTIQYLRPVTSGRIVAEAKIVRAGRRRFVVSVDVRNGDALIATAITGYVKIT
jgi:acyl-CoA thioesterase